MTNIRSDQKRILAIAPNSRGFGFALLEGIDLVDWGLVQVRKDKHERCLARMNRLITRYQPDVMITEDANKNRHRGVRIRKLLGAMHEQIAAAGISHKSYCPASVRRIFRGSSPVTKHTIAEGIASHFPELTPKLPGLRKPWMSEDARMAIFDAVALALTGSLTKAHSVRG